MLMTMRVLVMRMLVITGMLLQQLPGKMVLTRHPVLEPPPAHQSKLYNPIFMLRPSYASPSMITDTCNVILFVIIYLDISTYFTHFRPISKSES